MATLPPYETLVRWTVADTTKWLAENGLSEFKDSFKKDGVDGSKLAKLTDTDIDNYKVSSAKKRIQLKNAVANIDRSRVSSLPRTQGMMDAFRRSEPAPPPRPPRPGIPLPPDPEPPTNHAPPLPGHHNNSHHFDDENEDAYSWGEDFDYHSDTGSEDYENQQEWTTQDHNSNNIGYESQETYEAPESDEDGDEDYEQPIPNPMGAPTPARPPRPAPSKPQPQTRKSIETHNEEKPPPRPPPLNKRNPPPIPDQEEVYDEPDEEIKKTARVEKKKTLPRQLPPVPPPTNGERSLPPTPSNKGKGQHRPPKAPPAAEPEEVYEPMDEVPNPRHFMTPIPAQSRSPAKKPQKVPKVPSVPKDELDRYEWYHKNIERATAEKSLNELAEDGMYLIRKSRRGGTEQQYTLTIYKGGRVYNLPIRKREKDGKFALGAAKPNELDFDSVPSLIDYFKTKLIMLNPKMKSSAGSTRLVTPMPK